MRLHWLILFLLAGCISALGNEAYHGSCSEGNTTLTVPGLSVLSQKVTGTYATTTTTPCTVTVYLTGTLTLATIYADNQQPPTALANPFTCPTSAACDATGAFVFFSTNGRYDVRISVTGSMEPAVNPYTNPDWLLYDPGPPDVGVQYAGLFSGSDMGAQINNAYAALTAQGGFIHIPANPAGGCWTVGTTIDINTIGKPAKLWGAPGTCINYTGTGPGIVFDWGQSVGNYLHLIGGGMDTLTFNCTNAANTTCVSLGTTRNAEGYLIFNSKITGYASNALVDIVSTNGRASFAGMIQDSSIGGIPWTTAACVNLYVYNERVNFESDVIGNCAIGINGVATTGTDAYIHQTSIDDTYTAVVYNGGILTLVDDHCENASLLGGHQMLCLDTSTVSQVRVYGGLWAEDDSNAGHTNTSLWQVETTGTNIIMDGTVVFSAGAIIPQVIDVLNPSPSTTARINIFRTATAVQGDINPGFNNISGGNFLDIPGLGNIQPIVAGAIQTQTNVLGGGCSGTTFDLFDGNNNLHKFFRNNDGTFEITNAACSQVEFRQFDAGGISVHGATPVAELGGIGIGASTGFGNGSSGTAVTTTTKGSGTGPTTPQTVVGYIEINLGGTNVWVPYVQ